MHLIPPYQEERRGATTKIWKRKGSDFLLHTIRNENDREKLVPFYGTPDAACTKAQVECAVEELTTWKGREEKIPASILKPEVRRTCFQFLGPAPEHPLREYILHAPPDLMGKDNAEAWQERYRKRKEAEEAKAEEAEPPKKKVRKAAAAKRRLEEEAVLGVKVLSFDAQVTGQGHVEFVAWREMHLFGTRIGGTDKDRHHGGQADTR